MRQLRYAGPGEDAAHVIVEALDGTDRFTLVLDDDLRAAARQELPKLDRPESDGAPLSPREIQTRVRAGASAESVADESGLPLDKVMRFAYPVLQERARVADEARRARARRTTAGGDTGVFGEMVDGRLAVHGIDPAEVAWDSFRRLDGQWTVTAGWRESETDRFAQWSFGLSTRVISPLDETATDLLSDRPLRPVGIAEEVVEELLEQVEDVATVGGPYDDAALADPAHPTGPIPAPLRLAPPPAADADARRDPWEGEDWPDPTPRGLGSFFTPRPRPGGHHPSEGLPVDAVPAHALPVDAVPAHAVPVDAVPVDAVPMDAVPLDAVPVDPAEPLLPFAFEAPDANAPTGRRFRRHEAAEDESAEGKAARARIPSWDDILLGVRRRTD